MKGEFLGIPFIYLENLRINGFFYGFTTREIEKESVVKTFKNHGLRLITAKQIHSSKVLRVDKKSGDGIVADGLLTNEKNLFVGVKTADCLPVLLFDKNKKAVGAIHSGWRGTYNGIVSEGVKRMKEEFGSEPENLIALLGPSISKCCYEIGKDVENLLEISFSEFIEKRKGKIYFDIRGANRMLLIKAGLKDNNIFELPLCTMCEKELFFSHRRGEKGRNIAFVGISEKLKNG